MTEEYVITDPDAPATEKQTRMIYAVSAKKKVSDTTMGRMFGELKIKRLASMTKGQASRFIEALLALPDPPEEPALSFD